MTDNRTTELREKLDDLIIELDRIDIALDSPASNMTIGEYEQEREKLLDGFTQAIAATLGNDVKPCYATDYTHEHCKYSVNRGWVENVAHGTLTAEQVREAIEASTWAETSTILEFNDSSWQAIADELNAELGSGTCECVKGKCSNCGKDLPEDPYSDYEGNFCPSCGARIRKAVE